MILYLRIETMQCWMIRCTVQRIACSLRHTSFRVQMSEVDKLMPVVLDPIDNPFESAYAPWPLRLFVLCNGKIVYIGQPNHYLGDVRDAVERCLQTDVRAAEHGAEPVDAAPAEL